MNTQKGIAPIAIIAIIVLIGAGAYAIFSRDVLKTFFERGDKPTQSQSAKSVDTPEKGGTTTVVAASGDKPSVGQFKDVIDSSMNLQDDGLAMKKADPVVLTEEKKTFSLTATSGPVTFRWTPVVPKPQEPVTYRLRVWQLMQGESGSDAMRERKPMITRDIPEITNASVSGIYTGPCRPPYLCDYVWAVEALKTSTPTTGGSVVSPTPTSIPTGAPSDASGAGMPVEGSAVPTTDTGSR